MVGVVLLQKLLFFVYSWQASHNLRYIRPNIIQDFFRLKNGPFLPLLFVTSFWTSLYECRIIWAAPRKNKLHYWHQRNFESHHNTVSISTPWHKNRVNFDPDTKSESCSTPNQKQNQFRSIHWHQVNYGRWHNNQMNLIPSLKSSQVSSYTQVNFFYPQNNQVNFGAHNKTKRFLACLQKLACFWPPTQKLSQFRYHSKTKSILILHTKTKLVQENSYHGILYWTQVHFDPYSNIKFISMPRHKTK